MAGYEKRAILKPMDAGEAIDLGLRIYQKIAPLALKSTLVPMAICQAALTFGIDVVAPEVFLTRHGGDLKGELGEIVFALAVVLVVAAPLFCFGMARAMSSVASLASDVVLGKRPDPELADERSRRSAGVATLVVGSVLFWSSLMFLVSGAFAVVGLILDLKDPTSSLTVGLTTGIAVLILPVAFGAIPFILRANALAPVVSAIEGGSAKSALKRSRSLMRTHVGQGNTTTMLILNAMILAIVGSGLWSSLDFILEKSGLALIVSQWNVLPGSGQILQLALNSLPMFLTLWLLAPIWTTAATVLYYDRIVRLEAYDVKVMVDDLSHANRRSVLLR